MTSIRAKAQVQAVTTTLYSEQTKLSGVSSGKPEDNTFAKATPSLSIDITVDNPAAQGFLKAGKEYYVNFTEVPAEAPAAATPPPVAPANPA